MIKNLLSLVLILFAFQLIAQNTVGLISYKPSKVYDGYNLIFPHNQPNVYLIDNCGEIVHTWEDDAGFRPGNTAYLLGDGRLVKAKRPASVAGDAIWAGGGGGIVEIRDWDNNLEWSFELNDSLARLHHDIAIVEDPDSDDFTILMLAWELKTEEEALAAGRDTATTAQDKLWPDYILEVDPQTDEIIWEWHVWDHLIQDFDATKANYGVVADHPELVDVNWDTHDGHPDWMHGNAMDYDPINNQVLLSIPYFNEVWIIDHSTSTAGAASHNGGLSGRGGDLMYRWGNPATYDQGTADDQTIFFAHDIHWIDDFVDPFDPNFGKLALFNNRVGANYSTVNIFNPEFDMYEWLYPLDGNVFKPSDYDLVVTHPDTFALYSTGLSSMQYLPNGNLLICSGRFGYSFELTPDDEIVWEYKTPLIGGAPATQGDTLTVNNNLTFRMTRYPANYEAFDGRDLSQKGWLELEPDSTFCDQILPAFEQIKNYDLEIYPNPANDMITLKWEAGIYVEFEVFDLMGRQIVEPMRVSGGRKYLDTSAWEEGMYFVRINQDMTRKVIITR